MRTLIQRQNVPKYFGTYDIIFIPGVERLCEIQDVTPQNFKHLKESCGEFYLDSPLNVGDIIFRGLQNLQRIEKMTPTEIITKDLKHGDVKSCKPQELKAQWVKTQRIMVPKEELGYDL